MKTMDTKAKGHYGPVSSDVPVHVRALRSVCSLNQWLPQVGFIVRGTIEWRCVGAWDSGTDGYHFYLYQGEPCDEELNRCLRDCPEVALQVAEAFRDSCRETAERGAYYGDEQPPEKAEAPNDSDSEAAET